ncbi:hypothetical protein [Roseateles violae]|uniref:PEP-CTERM protein-sorting domain-containing protein n=1 Tax=Roseateles violae TaxID=3058042 RepID=A0ABT8DW33_9BURK|nr:hypothetical protein [Pelomonas sp. PFR6]MDN3920597.1 hypothetical protein [Pelomonas sp. PFR6]
MGLLSASAAASAASGQIDSFGASSTAVLAGESVELTAWFSVQTTAGSYTESSPEPDPAEGPQIWEVGRTVTASELLDSVSLSISAIGRELLLHPAAFPGAGFSDHWTISLPFTQPGLHYLELNGSWTSNTQQTTVTQVATRNCGTDDTGVFGCSPWDVQSTEQRIDFPSGGSFEARGIEIHVSALPVPEPARAGLWVLGLGAVLSVAGRRSSSHLSRRGYPALA